MHVSACGYDFVQAAAYAPPAPQELHSPQGIEKKVRVLTVPV
jgi:hypothetical protein